MNVGIDSISVYIPKTYLSLTGQWARERATSFTEGDVEKLVQKVKKGVGVTKVSIPDMHEDAATMAAMAVKELLKTNKIDLDQIGYLAIATESAVDQSKSMASYVLGMLEDYYQKRAPHIGCVEYKFACVGSAYALEAAVALVSSSRLERQYAVVVATDVAKYDLNTAGEYTQGAGAVAMLIAKEPRLLELNNTPMATYTCNERDFYRPNWRSTPVVDGKYSMDVYCNCVYQAFNSFIAGSKEHASRELMSSVDDLLFHLPFPRMAEYATARLLMPFLNGQSFERLSPEERKRAHKEFVTTEEFKRFFAEKVERSLELSQEVGNIYTGALYLGLASLLETALRDGKELSGHRAIFCAYGSGASSKVFGATFTPHWREAAQNLKTISYLRDIEQGGQRVSISMKDYGRLHGKDSLQTTEEFESVIPAKDEFALVRFGNEETKNKVDLGFRYYSFIK